MIMSSIASDMAPTYPRPRARKPVHVALAGELAHPGVNDRVAGEAATPGVGKALAASPAIVT